MHNANTKTCNIHIRLVVPEISVFKQTTKLFSFV